WPADSPDFDGSSFSSGAEPPAVDSPPPADPPLSADSAESLFFGCSGSGLGVSTFVSIVISSGSSLACFFALAKNSSVACVGTAVATAGASATTCPPGAASRVAMARLEATTAAVAAVGTMNAESTCRVRTAASTPPAVFARSGECRPDLFFAVSAEKREPFAFVLGAECLPTVMFLVVVTQCPVNSEPEGKDSTQHG